MKSCFEQIKEGDILEGDFPYYGVQVKALTAISPYVPDRTRFIHQYGNVKVQCSGGLIGSLHTAQSSRITRIIKKPNEHLPPKL